jgi:hypothetical protein
LFEWYRKSARINYPLSISNPLGCTGRAKGNLFGENGMDFTEIRNKKTETSPTWGNLIVGIAIVLILTFWVVWVLELSPF